MTPAQPSTDSPPPQPRRFQFSLCSLLAVTAIYGLAAFVARPSFESAEGWGLAALTLVLATPLAVLIVVVPHAALWGLLMGCMFAVIAFTLLLGRRESANFDNLLRASFGIGLYTAGICGGVRAVRTPHNVLGWTIALGLTVLFFLACCFSVFP